MSASGEAFARAAGLAERVGSPPFLGVSLEGIQTDLARIRGEGYDLALPGLERFIAQDVPELRWVMALVWATVALLYAFDGRDDDALQALHRVLPAIERAAGWAFGYTAILHWAIEALWILERRDRADALERNLREKTLAPDFRFPHTDARLALARLCALTGRFDEARTWFEKARRVLDEQQAQPLRALVDFDEAWMEVRRSGAGDRERARGLLDAARGPFQSIGMPGWLRRADELRRELER